MKSKLVKPLTKIVWEQGFSLEDEIFKYLQKSHWTIEPNQYYKDSLNGIIREIDLVATKFFEFNSYKIFITIVIECKYAKSSLVFYTRSLKNKNYPILVRFGTDLEKRYGFKDLAQIIKSLKQYGGLFFSEEQVFGIQSFRSSTKNNTKKNSSKTQSLEVDSHTQKDLTSGITGVASATYYLRDNLFYTKKVDSKNMHLYFPLVVVSGDLFRAFLGLKKKTLSKESIFKYKVGINKVHKVNETVEFYVYIVDKVGMLKVMRMFNQIFNKISKDIRLKLIPLPKTNLPF